MSNRHSLYCSIIRSFGFTIIRLEADYVPVIDPDDGNLVSILGYLDVVHLLDQGKYFMRTNTDWCSTLSFIPHWSIFPLFFPFPFSFLPFLFPSILSSYLPLFLFLFYFISLYSYLPLFSFSLILIFLYSHFPSPLPPSIIS